MKYALVFFTLAGACASVAFQATSWIPRVAFAYTALSFTGVGCAYALARPETLLKRATGTISPLGRVLFAPFHALSEGAFFLQRSLSRESSVDDVGHGLWLGRLPRGHDIDRLESLGIRAVLDLTAEFSASRRIRKLEYLSIPVLDGLPPSPRQLAECVDWISHQLRSGPVLVHCALGHGRSATVAAAFLASRSAERDAGVLVDSIHQARPGIGLNQEQLRALQLFINKLP